MEILKDRYSITELSERLKVTDHALRYYEKEFCLEIPKDSRGRRYYTTELANVMYQIKNMRDQGLEIKAIRKILQSEDNAGDPPPVVRDDDTAGLVPVKQSSEINQKAEIYEI
jgi:DNA-binding transcriptional MerR regulator